MIDQYFKDNMQVEVEDGKITCDGETYADVRLIPGSSDYDQDDRAMMALEYDVIDGEEVRSAYVDGIYTKGYTPNAYDFYLDGDDDPLLAWHTDYDKTDYDVWDEVAMDVSAELAWCLCHMVEELA